MVNHSSSYVIAHTRYRVDLLFYHRGQNEYDFLSVFSIIYKNLRFLSFLEKINNLCCLDWYLFEWNIMVKLTMLDCRKYIKLQVLKHAAFRNKVVDLYSTSSVIIDSYEDYQVINPEIIPPMSNWSGEMKYLFRNVYSTFATKRIQSKHAEYSNRTGTPRRDHRENSYLLIGGGNVAWKSINR